MLKQHHETLWTWSIPYKIGPILLGARTTLLKCGDGLLLHSPVKFDEAGVKAIGALGEVKWIVAPSSTHHLFAGHAKQAFPKAKLIVAPSLVAKRKDLAIDGTLDQTTFPDTTTLRVEGAPKLDEYLFVHHPSRTLVVTDFLFHYPTHPQWLMRRYLKFADALGKPAQTSLTRRNLRDRDAVRGTRDALLALDWDRLVVTHGEVLEAGGKQALVAATAWLD